MINVMILLLCSIKTLWVWSPKFQSLHLPVSLPPFLFLAFRRSSHQESCQWKSLPETWASVVPVLLWSHFLPQVPSVFPLATRSFFIWDSIGTFWFPMQTVLVVLFHFPHFLFSFFLITSCLRRILPWNSKVTGKGIHFKTQV